MIQKILALVMAFLMLASTVSWTIEKHYCFGSLVDIAFFHEADTCGINLVSAKDFASLDKGADSCCNDEIISIQGQDNLKMSHPDVKLGQQFFLIAFPASYIGSFQSESGASVPHEDYPPPILVKDIHVLDQVFLI